MSTAERQTPHRKLTFAKPLIDNYLREIGEIGPDKRRSDAEFEVSLGRAVGYSDRWSFGGDAGFP